MKEKQKTVHIFIPFTLISNVYFYKSYQNNKKKTLSVLPIEYCSIASGVLKCQEGIESAGGELLLPESFSEVSLEFDFKNQILVSFEIAFTFELPLLP